MGKILYDSESIRNAASQIARKVSELESKVNQIDTIVMDIEGAWKGTASDAYVQNLMGKKQDLTKIINKLKELPSCFNKIADSNDEVQNRITSAINSK